MFVRQGEYDPSIDTIPLSDIGQRQARAAGVLLSEWGMQGSIVLSSAANRAAQTAQAITTQIHGSGPHISEALWFQSMAPKNIDNLDDFLVELSERAGEYDTSKPLIAVAHAELLSRLPGNIKALSEVAFCEIVEYVPGTWIKPTN